MFLCLQHWVERSQGSEAGPQGVTEGFIQQLGVLSTIRSWTRPRTAARLVTEGAVQQQVSTHREGPMKRPIAVLGMCGVLIAVAWLVFGAFMLAKGLPHHRAVVFPGSEKVVLIKAADGAELRVEGGSLQVLSGMAGTWSEPTYHWDRLALAFGLPFSSSA